MKKITLLLIFCLFSTNLIASSFDIKNFNQDYKGKEIWNKDKSILITHGNLSNTKNLNKNIIDALNIDNVIINKYLKNLKVETWLYEKSPLLSFSNAQQNDCEINIGYNENFNGLLLEDIKKDTLFVLTHEISHCILGKEIFLKGIKWKYDLSENQIKELDKIIYEKTNKGISILNAKPTIEKPIPIIVYHEMFADTFATIWLYSQNKITKEDIKNIIRVRRNDFEFKNKETAYVSFLPLEEVLSLINKNPNFFKDKDINYLYEYTILLIQKNFLNYLTK